MKLIQFVLIALLLVPMRLRADTETARKAFNAATSLFTAGDYEAAVDGFRKAYDADPHWKLYYNIAQCEAALKRYGLALEAFERYIAAGGDELPDARQTEVQEEIKRLREMVGTVVIQSLRGAEIIVNGTLMGKLPISGGIRVSAGVDHEVAVKLAGYHPFTETLFVGSGQTIELQADLIADTPVTVIDGSNKVHSPLMTAGWIAAGTGVALLATGGVLGGVALSKNSDIVIACGDAPCPDQRDEVASRDTLAVASTILLATGGAIAAAGLVSILIGAKHRPGRTVSLMPAMSPTTAMTVLKWGF